MKILLVVNSDIGRKGTIGFRFGKIAEFLKEKNVSFTLIARSNYQENLKVISPFYKNYFSRFLNAIRIYLFPSFFHRKYDVYFFDQFVLNFLKKIEIDFDIAFFGDYLFRSISFLKEKKVKIGLDLPMAHPIYHKFLEEKNLFLDEKFKRIPDFLKKSIEKADFLVAPSLFVKETLIMAKVEKPVEVVPFGVDLPKNFSEKEIEKRLKFPLKFIFAGNVNRRKGVNFLLKAWQELNLKEAELLICGRVYQTIRKELRKYQLSKVKFLGFVDLDKYFRKAHVFVFPTLMEGSAKVVYEAASYGLPVITTFNAGSVIEDKKSGFIIPIGDVEALKEKMLYFYENPQEIVRMGRNAYNLIKNYSWQKYAQNVFEVLKKYASSK